jgi:hypothetical protein
MNSGWLLCVEGPHQKAANMLVVATSSINIVVYHPRNPNKPMMSVASNSNVKLKSVPNMVVERQKYSKRKQPSHHTALIWNST